MKLVRYGAPGAEKPGLIDENGDIRDLSAHVHDIAGDALHDTRIARLRALDSAQLPKVNASVRLGSCIGSIGKFMCIGLNYSDHA
ncbi:MAG: 2-hydroxyhepta-2,4-diene-1,7-dioate isomerase, partial [Pseudomonadota bacterium]